MTPNPEIGFSIRTYADSSSITNLYCALLTIETRARFRTVYLHAALEPRCFPVWNVGVRLETSFAIETRGACWPYEWMKNVVQASTVLRTWTAMLVMPWCEALAVHYVNPPLPLHVAAGLFGLPQPLCDMFKRERSFAECEHEVLVTSQRVV